ncbi:MAG: hypothetical protein WB987_11135 [Candidatus Acidiferrales bacterium]
MPRRIQIALCAALLPCLMAAFFFTPAAAQDAEPEILARARVFPDVGPGLIALQRDASGRYYVAASPGNTILIFGADGKRLGQIPGANPPAASAAAPDAAKNSKIVFVADFDIDSAGRVLVADRGANAVKIFAPDGSLTSSISIPAPTSIAALPGDEFAVTSLRYRRLMMIYGDTGTLVRAIGNPEDFAPRVDLSRTPDLGRVSADSAGNIYFVFSFLPVPTIRRFDRFGYAGNEISLDEFAPEAHRRELLSLERHGNLAATKLQIDALGIDPTTQEIWIAVGNELLRFNNLGARLGSYRAFSPAGARLVPKTILVEPDRILLGTDPFGVFDFAKPAKAPAATSSH